ncbi:MAG: hypothetical protein QMD36_00300 [Candidatus Aenigmarchaeota archaeon]|nr:hypothetical protein [Candidatus Aenigmarchaeota archaeon]
MDDFLRDKLKPREKDGIEYGILDNFKNNRVLFTAPHAYVKKIYLPEFGERAYVNIGDRNTGRLTRIVALHTRTAFMIPKVLRTRADPARPPDELGKGLKLFATVMGTKNKELRTYLEIHKNRKFLHVLEKYHELISNLSPKGIICFHGMHLRREFDVLLGFGKRYEMILGKKNAFRFKKELIEKIHDAFPEFGFRQEMKIAVSKILFTGEMNYVLAKHVIEHNKKSQKKRIGINVELNLRGRVSKDDKNLPTPEYQLACQILGELSIEWTRKLTS